MADAFVDLGRIRWPGVFVNAQCPACGRYFVDHEVYVNGIKAYLWTPAWRVMEPCAVLADAS